MQTENASEIERGSWLNICDVVEWEYMEISEQLFFLKDIRNENN